MPYTDNQMAKTKERLEDLRQDKDLSYEQLSKVLKEQGIFISHTNLRNYEINDNEHSLYERTRGMSIENLVALADFFDVSVDYLLGRSNSKKIEYHQISEELKLADEVIEILISFVSEDLDMPFYMRRNNMLNMLLSSEDALEAFKLLQTATVSLERHLFFNPERMIDRKLQDEAYESAEKKIGQYGMTAVDSRVISDLYTEKAVELISHKIKELPKSLLDDYHKRLAEDDWGY